MRDLPQWRYRTATVRRAARPFRARLLGPPLGLYPASLRAQCLRTANSPSELFIRLGLGQPCSLSFLLGHGFGFRWWTAWRRWCVPLFLSLRQGDLLIVVAEDVEVIFVQALPLVRDMFHVLASVTDPLNGLAKLGGVLLRSRLPEVASGLLMG